MPLRLLSVQQSCIAICRDLRLLDLQQYEDQASDETLNRLKSKLSGFVQMTLALLEKATNEPIDDRDGTDDSVRFRLGIDQVMRDSDAQERLTFLSNLSTGVLRSKSQRMHGLNNRMDWLDVLEVFASIMRCILKTLVALEHCAADLAQVTPQLNFFTETQKGLRVRRLYGELRYELEDAAATEDHIEHSLRRAGVSIAKMMRLDSYEFFRFNDRHQLTDIKERLRRWFAKPHDEKEGKHLFDDIRFTVQLLMDINHREELIEHDLATVKECLRCIETQQLETIPKMLQDLIGRSRKLDEMIFTFTDNQLLFKVLNELEGELNFVHG